MERFRVGILIAVIAASVWGARAAEGPLRLVYGAAVFPEDALAGVPACTAAEAAAPRPGTLDDAVGLLAACAAGLSQRYGLDVRAAKGVLENGEDRSDGMGILLQVPASLPKGSRILVDLSYAVRERRNRMLLGFPAGVWSGSLEGGTQTPPQGAPSVPVWLDGRSLKLEAKLTKMDLHGNLHAVLFDKDDNELELVLPAAPAQGGRIVAVFVKSSDEELGPWPVETIEAHSPGALGGLAASIAIPAELDARLRPAVQRLLSELRRLGSAAVRP